MKKLSKKVLAVTSGLAILTSPLGTYISAEGKSESPIRTAAISINNSQLQKMMDQEKHKLVSEDTLVIQYDKPLSTSELNRVGLKVVRHLPQLKSITVKLSKKEDATKALRFLTNLPKIKSIQPSAMYQPASYGDPKATEIYHLEMLNILEAQKLAGDKKIRVGVIDQGIDTNHPELKDKLLNGYNAINPVSSPTPDYHGTHVAGIIGAEKGNGVGGYGINPNVEIVPIDVFDRSWGTSDYIIAEGILHAIEKDVDVINMSLGGYFPSTVLKDAVQKAVDAGITVVAAAGNGFDEHANYPASYEGVISVGNVNSKKELSETSSRGPSVDLVAYGEDVYAPIYDYEKKSSFQKLTGTSMASPIVAGVASLLLSKYPDMSPAEVDYILKQTTDDLGPTGFDNEFAYGLINPVAALKYNRAYVPDHIKNPLSSEDFIKNASELTVDGKEVWTERFTKPNEEHWAKVSLKKGETIELTLKGSDAFDYSLLYKWEDGDLQTVNGTRQGKNESILLKADKDTTLLVGMKDTYGHYANKARNESEASLTLYVPETLPEDKLTLEKPYAVTALPFNIETETLFTGIEDQADEDFYTFTVDEPTTLKISLSAIPGVDTSFAIYDKFSLFPEGEITEETMEAASVSLTSEEPVYPMEFSSGGGVDTEESLVFEAMPGMEYYLKVTNKSEFFGGFYDFFFDPYFFMMDFNGAHTESLKPYSLSMKEISLPEDEDGLPQALDEMMNPEMPQEDSSEEMDYVHVIKNNALSLEEVDTAFLQNLYDNDWFKFTAKETGLLELDLAKGTFVPLVEVYELGEYTYMDENEEEVTREDFRYLGDNVHWGWTSLTMKEKMYLSVEEGKEYFLNVMNSYYQPKLEEGSYSISKSEKGPLPREEWEPNNSFEEATPLKDGKVTGLFSTNNDNDIYYLENTKADIYGFSLKRQEVTNEMKKLYPKEILSPYYAVAGVIEDVNKNKQLDPEEYESAILFDKGIYEGYSYGSFKAKEGASYFVEVFNFFDSNTRFSVVPYDLEISPALMKDEDAENTGRSIKDAKPLSMTKVYSQLWKADGYLTAVEGQPDADWYTFTLDKHAEGIVRLDAPVGIDGVIELYKDGKLLKTADYYPMNDDEVLHVNLEKGTYVVKVKDALGQGSALPYQLRVFVK
ncbi:S8 family peptidase [Mangrovibacillus cuniculi]|uniref:S8 family peptidase n=1 Tax=Mangrovibacillus cuniculi TaxID=2593652 RepID=A0A7S8CCQ8_9BACI|nr:S8 family peptidase [Mangrovibacillus cuniculi]QPC47568.1 S8 family peptidase [Mangrovibacillus cuniculi]